MLRGERKNKQEESSGKVERQGGCGLPRHIRYSKTET